MVSYIGWRKGQRNPVPEPCRKCEFHVDADTSLSRFYCWAGVLSGADAHACGKRKVRRFPPAAVQGGQD